MIWSARIFDVRCHFGAFLTLTCWTCKFSWTAFGQEFSVWQHQLIRYPLDSILWIWRLLRIQTSCWCNTEVWKRDVTTSPRHKRNSWESLWRSRLSGTCPVFFGVFFRGGFRNWRVPGEVYCRGSFMISGSRLIPDDLAMLAFLSQVGFACFHDFRRMKLNHKPQVNFL